MDKLIDAPNMDAMDEEELAACVEGFRRLAEYAQVKLWAVKARKEGRIEAALHNELHCDKLYKQLPEVVDRW